MIVKYLELENYRRFEHVQLELPQGIIGIIGLNGVGKSTLVEAVAWALYGNEPPITRTKKGEVKRSGAAPKDPCRVVLDFTLNGDNYHLVREIKGASQTISAELSINNRSEATGAKPVTELLHRRLGMDYQAFFASVFARQKELNALSSETPNARKKLVLRMLNIDFLEKVKSTIGKDKRYSIKFIEGLKAGITDSEGRDIEEKCKEEQLELKTNQQVIKKELKELEQDKKEKGKELAKVTKDFTAYEKKHKKYKTLKSGLDEIERTETKHNADKTAYERELDKLKGEESELSKLAPEEKKFSELENEKMKLESAAELHNKHESIKSQVKRNTEKQAKLNEQHGNFTKQLEFFTELESDLQQLSDARVELEAAMVAVNDKISRQNQSEVQLNRMIKDKESHRKDIENLGKDSVCPTCERPLDEHYDFLQGKLEGELTDKRVELNAVGKHIKELGAEKKKLEKNKAELDKKDKELSQSKLRREEVRARVEGFKEQQKKLESETVELEKELKALPKDTFDEKRFSAVKEQLSKLKSTHERYIILKESVSRIPGVDKSIKDLVKKLQKTEKEHKKITDEITGLGFDEEEFKELSDRRFSVTEDFQKAERELLVKSGELKHALEKIESLEKQILELQHKKGEISTKEEQVSYLSTLEEIMDKFKISLISRIRPLLSRYGSEFIIKLTDGKYSELELDENYDIYIFDEGEKYELKRFSGGEEDIANLCIRLAISRVIAESAGTTGVNMIILDEIFGSQDLYRKRNIVSLLNELTNQYQQIFLITHVEEMKERMGFVIDVSEDSESDCSTVKILN